MASHALITLSDSTASTLLPNVTGLHNGADFTVQNVDETAIVYIGGEGVTTTDYGFKLTPGAAWSVELSGYDHLYAISDTNGSKVATLKVNLED